MGEKGSIRNLYKEWRLFLKKKKKKAKELEEEKRLKKQTSKVRAFVITFFAFLFSPFFFGERKRRKSVAEIKVEIVTLQGNIEKEQDSENIKKYQEVLKEYEKELLVISKEEEKKDNVFVSKKKEETKAEVFHLLEEVTFIQNGIVERLKKTTPKLEVQKESSLLQEEPKEVFIEKKETIPFKEKQSSFVLSKSKAVGIGLDANILLFLKNSTALIDEIKLGLKNSCSDEVLKGFKKKVQDLRGKRLNLFDCYDIARIRSLYRDKDKYHLLETSIVLDELEIKCSIQKEEKEEAKKEDKPKNEEKEVLVMDEVNALKNVIRQDILNQKIRVSKVKKEFMSAEVSFRRPTLLRSIQKMAVHAFQICFSFLPLKMFRNKWVGGLASAFLFNNSIRSIRNTMRAEEMEYITYQHIQKQIKNEMACIQNTRYVYEDAGIQLRYLKQELLEYFNVMEVQDILKQIEDMELELSSKKRELSSMEMELENSYLKSKQKVKRKVA